MQKQTPKRKQRRKAVPVLGAAGLSLSLASGASGGPAANLPTPTVEGSHEIFLAEEEISDVSLATFYVFDKENTGSFRPGVQLVRGGCGGCGGGRGCGGCGGAEAEAVGVAAFGAAPAVSASEAVSASGVPGVLLSPAQAAEDIGAAAVCRGAPVVTVRRVPAAASQVDVGSGRGCSTARPAPSLLSARACPTVRSEMAEHAAPFYPAGPRARQHCRLPGGGSDYLAYQHMP